MQLLEILRTLDPALAIGLIVAGLLVLILTYAVAPRRSIARCSPDCPACKRHAERIAKRHDRNYRVTR